MSELVRLSKNNKEKSMLWLGFEPMRLKYNSWADAYRALCSGKATLIGHFVEYTKVVLLVTECSSYLTGLTA